MKSKNCEAHDLHYPLKFMACMPLSCLTCRSKGRTTGNFRSEGRSSKKRKESAKKKTVVNSDWMPLQGRFFFYSKRSYWSAPSEPHPHDLYEPFPIRKVQMWGGGSDGASADHQENQHQNFSLRTCLYRGYHITSPLKTCLKFVFTCVRIEVIFVSTESYSFWCCCFKSWTSMCCKFVIWLKHWALCNNLNSRATFFQHLVGHLVLVV